MEAFLFDLLKIFLQALFFLGLVMISIWFYFRMKPAPRAPVTAAAPEPSSGKETSLTLKLQACERLILFLERITPNHLILRVMTPDMTALQLQGALTRTVREEFEYNLSQQLYLSTKTWDMVRNAKEETIRLINTAASEMKEGSTARDLAGTILQIDLKQERSPVTQAIEAIKREVR